MTAGPKVRETMGERDADPRAEAMASAARRWLGRIDETSGGHWPWPGQLGSDGSPICQVGVEGKQIGWRAGRLLWTVLVGPIPDGFVVRRTCQRDGCVNPAHARAMSRVELGRIIDTPMGRNARKVRCLNGHPLEGEGSDVYRRRSGPGRQCRQCDRERERGRGK
jgi:hypothetical protein